MGKVRCQLRKAGGETEAQEVKEPTQSRTDLMAPDLMCMGRWGEDLPPSGSFPMWEERGGKGRGERRRQRSSKELTPGDVGRGRSPGLSYRTQSTNLFTLRAPYVRANVHPSTAGTQSSR